MWESKESEDKTSTTIYDSGMLKCCRWILMEFWFVGVDQRVNEDNFFVIDWWNCIVKNLVLYFTAKYQFVCPVLLCSFVTSMTQSFMGIHATIRNIIYWKCAFNRILTASCEVPWRRVPIVWYWKWNSLSRQWIKSFQTFSIILISVNCKLISVWSQKLYNGFLGMELFGFIVTYEYGNISLGFLELMMFCVYVWWSACWGLYSSWHRVRAMS